MCKETNSPSCACNTSIDNLVNGSGAVIKWCKFTIRTLEQLAAYYQLTPSNCSTAMTTINDNNSQQETHELIFYIICKAVNCWFPANKQFAAVIHPRLLAKLNSVLRTLDREGVIVIYRLPKSHAQQVYWPVSTRSWAKSTWDGDHGGLVDAKIRRELAMLREGHGSIPQVVLDAADGVQDLPFIPIRRQPAAAAVSSTNVDMHMDSVIETPQIETSRHEDENHIINSYQHHEKFNIPSHHVGRRPNAFLGIPSCLSGVDSLLDGGDTTTANTVITSATSQACFQRDLQHIFGGAEEGEGSELSPSDSASRTGPHGSSTRSTLSKPARRRQNQKMRKRSVGSPLHLQRERHGHGRSQAQKLRRNQTEFGSHTCPRRCR